MATLTQTWEEKGRVKGRAEGMEAGMKKGLEAQRQTLLRLLEWRFHLSEAQKRAYQKQLAQITDLQVLTQLIDQLLATQTLAEFDLNLLTSLSSANESSNQ